MLSLHLLSAAGAYVHQLVVRHVPCEHGALVHAGKHAVAVADVRDVLSIGVDDDHDDGHCSAAAPPPPATPSVAVCTLVAPLLANGPGDETGLGSAEGIVAVALLRLAPKGSPPQLS